MGFADFLIVLMLFVVLPAIILGNIRKIKEAKYRALGKQQDEAGEEQGALRMSELQLLIEAAVDEATAPLRARVEMLEDERLLAAPPPLALEAPEPEAEPGHPVVRTRQTA